MENKQQNEKLNEKLIEQYRDEAWKIGFFKYDTDEYVKHRINGLSANEAYARIINDIARQV